MAYVASAGVDIYYESSGSGPAILFAHGAGGNGAIWFEQVAHFSPNYQCITFDHRSFARSPCDPATISTRQFRDDALAILDDLGIDQAHVVAQSMGGFTALRLALDAPERVLSVTMSCTPGGLPNPQPTTATRDLLSNQGKDAGSILDTMSRASLVNHARMRLYHEISAFNTQFSWANLGALGVVETQISFDEAGTIACPVFFISGAEDPLFPPALLESYVPHFKQARFVLVEDAGHSPYFERPDVFNQHLAHFLSTQAT